MDTVEQSPAEVRDQLYDGFISYSHAADDLLAPRLQSALQQFAKPWWKRRAVRIFRDESSLSANPHLWSSITEALDTSGWFVLLLSADAAQSEWVNQEIAYWVEHRDPKKILPVVTDGTFGWAGSDVAGDAVPDAIRGVFSEEPRWVDVRWVKDGDQLDLQDPRFADAVADIASTIRGIPKDDLASEEVRQHRRTVRTAWAAGGLVTVLAVVAVGFGVSSARNADEAERQAAIAEENAAAELAARREADANAASALESAALAKARELAASAVSVGDDDPELAVLLGLAAIDAAPPGDELPVEVIDSLWTAASDSRLEAVVDSGRGEIATIDLSRDGSRLAVSVTEGATLQMYDTDALAEPIWEYREITADSFGFVRFSPDGRRVALGVGDSTSNNTFREPDLEKFPEFSEVVNGDELPARVVIFDVATGGEVVVLEFPDCPDIDLPEWSPDGNHLVVTQAPPGPGRRCIRDGSPGGQWIEVFDTATWKAVQLIDTPMVEAPFDAPLPAFDEEGRLYVFGFGQGPRVYEPDGYRLTAEFEEVGPLAVSPDGSLFAAWGARGGFDHSLVDSTTGARIDALAQAEARPTVPNGLRFSPDGRMVISSSVGAYIYVWDVESGELTDRLRGGSGSTPVFDAERQRLYTGHADGLVRVWNLGQPTVGREPAGNLGTASWVNGTGFSIGPDLGAFEAIDFEADEGYVRLFDLETGALRDEMLEGNDQLALPDGRFAYSRNYEEYVLYDPATEAETPLIGCATEDRVTCVDSDDPWINYRGILLSAAEDELAVVSDAGDEESSAFALTFLDVQTGAVTEEITFQYDLLEVYALSADWVLFDDGRQAIAVDRSGETVLWESNIRASRFNLGPSRTVASVVDYDLNTLHIIDLGSWDTRVLPFGVGQVRGAEFNESETLLALGDENNLSIVDLPTNEIIQRIPIGGVSDVHWFDDSHLLVGTRDGVWARLSLNAEYLIDDVRANLLRGFTAQECELYRIDPCPTLDELRAG